jgi:hypothetical protein
MTFDRVRAGGAIVKLRLEKLYEEDGMRSLILICVVLLGIAANAQPTTAAEARLFVRHEVNDYTAWRKAYNEFNATRWKLGVTNQGVYRTVENGNDIIVKSVEQAKAFVSSPDLKAAMDKAGVKGSPQIWITTKAAR